jgi:outer membrane protein OmpA-like peptidoglycan-associated protein
MLSRGLTRLGLAALLTLVAFGAAPSATQADTPPAIPDAGHFSFASNLGTPFVGVVHAVRRVSGSTVLYLSIGTVDKTQRSFEGSSASAFLDYGAKSTDQGYVMDSSLRLLRLVDKVAGKVYRPIQTEGAPECICTPMSKSVPRFDAKTQLVTFAAAFPPLPTGVTSVDVDVTGKGYILPDVPVTDGPELTPATGNGAAVIMGQGWPKLDLTAAAAVTNVKPFVTDLLAVQTSTDNSVRSQSTHDKAGIDISSDVLFAVDKDSLNPAATSRLATVAAKIKQSAAGAVHVTGYTDNTGSTTHNQDLSQRRARSVAAALRRLAPGVSFTAVGRGESHPVASNSDPGGRALNRRVSVQFATKASR